MSRSNSHGAEPFVPAKAVGLIKLQEAAQSCRGCDLYKNATQAVFGAGNKSANIMLIGEQPGDQEDRAGQPFVGPAGQLLDKALSEAGIAKDWVYVTNAVKHFKWTPRGKRRIHARPSAREVQACVPWLQREIDIIHPTVLVTLGATAGQSLFGAGFRVKDWRGKERRDSAWAPCVVATVHPASLLRLPDRSEFDNQFWAFVEDLKLASAAAGRLSLHTSIKGSPEPAAPRAGR